MFEQNCIIISIPWVNPDNLSWFMAKWMCNYSFYSIESVNKLLCRGAQKNWREYMGTSILPVSQWTLTYLLLMSFLIRGGHLKPFERVGEKQKSLKELEITTTYQEGYKQHTRQVKVHLFQYSLWHR